MKNHYFFSTIQENKKNKSVLETMEKYSGENKKQIYVIKSPLAEENFHYDFEEAIVVLIPGHKILFFNLGDEEKFKGFVEDFIEDLGHLANKYLYDKKLGRPRNWKDKFISNYCNLPAESIISIIEENKLQEIENVRIVDLLISLLIGSINNIQSIDIKEPKTILEKLKQNIVLYDGDQTRFLFGELRKDLIKIQGLAGTGKTELLLHKLKDLYVRKKESRIAFTCHSKTLANSLKKRVPDFFTFMKVQEQIKWNSRLWVHRSWGSEQDYNSGLYSFICNYYNIPFQRFGKGVTFKNVCKNALDMLNQKKNFSPFFDYILIDESQDFHNEFFDLCNKITKKRVYVAGDIFQTIFDTQNNQVQPDFLLNKCYRTDPRTLMFSHAVGLALFEKTVINWLKDEEWKRCGYDLEKKENKYILKRDKIRRFEEIEALKSIMPVELFCEKEELLLQGVVNIIKTIKKKHKDVKPTDIAIVFVDDNKKIYRLIDELEFKINDELDWEANKGYKYKEQIENTIFISNRNNIKGLEFPFLICVITDSITKSIVSRNTLYMALTRSFLTSYLLISDKNRDVYKKWDKGLKSILENNYLKITKPSKEQILSKEQLELLLPTSKTYTEILAELFNELNIPHNSRKNLEIIVMNHISESESSFSKTKIKKIVEANWGLMNE